MAEADVRQAKGRYRKVEVRTWGDEKFRRLTPIPPCGQGLWLFLITGPHTGPIPGLFRAGRAAMAEELDWEVEDFDKAFGEAFREGMVKADFKARVVWVPKAINHNRPESPNVVLSWAAEFDLIPECALKWEALEVLRAFVYGLGEAFAKAFDRAFGKASPKALPKTMPNQEQEQEQEQEEDEATDVALPTADGDAAADADGEGGGDAGEGEDLLGKVPKKVGTPPCPHLKIIDLYHEVLPELTEVRVWEGERERKLAARWKGDKARQNLDWWRSFFESVRGMPFLMGERTGRDGRAFTCTLEWLVSPKNFAKVIEGNYVDLRR